MHVYEFFGFDRYWDRSHERVTRQTLKRHVEQGHAMFGSVPIPDLMRDGFVVMEGRNRVYLAPDAAVMLSDPFLDTHCFRVLPRGFERAGCG